MNSVALTGRTAAQIELKQTQSGKSVATFRLAVKRPFTKDDVDFFTVTAWGKQAETLSTYVGKGQMLAILGHLRTSSWTDKNGNKRTDTLVELDSFDFCESKKQQDSIPDASTYVPEAYTAPNFEEISGDDELPF